MRWCAEINRQAAKSAKAMANTELQWQLTSEMNSSFVALAIVWRTWRLGGWFEYGRVNNNYRLR